MIKANNKIAANWLKIATDLQSQLLASEEDKIKLSAQIAENERLREALTFFAEQMCVRDLGSGACGRLSYADCPGCRARAALQPKEGNQ